MTVDNLKEFNSKNSGSKPSSKITIIVLIVLLLGFGTYHYFKLNQTTQTLTAVNEEKEDLTYQYQGLLDDYGTLETQNDTLNARLSKEQERIKEIMTELRSTKAQNKEEIRKYKKELQTLRDVMKSFIVQIDSLNQSNIALRAENKEIKQQYYSEKQKSQQLSENLEEQKEKVAIASVIRAINMSLEAFNEKGKPKNKANKIKRLAVRFTLDENPITPKGTKRIYVRFTDPDDHVLIHNEQPMMDFEGEEIAYSSYREIDYQGTAVDGIVYYEHKSEEPLTEGTYKVDIFCDGSMIGSTSIELN